jgi:hypothetical protein
MDEDGIISITVLVCCVIFGILAVVYAWYRTKQDEKNGFYGTI